MRQVGIFVKFTKREEQELFAYYYECRSKARMDSHNRNLDFVKNNLIEGNNDLTFKVWNIFLDTIIELGIDFDKMNNVIKPHPIDPGKGASYRIPPEDKNKIGHLAAISKRNKWRESFRLAFAPIYEIDPHVDDARAIRPKLQIVDGGVS